MLLTREDELDVKQANQSAERDVAMLFFLLRLPLLCGLERGTKRKAAICGCVPLSLWVWKGEPLGQPPCFWFVLEGGGRAGALKRTHTHTHTCVRLHE